MEMVGIIILFALFTWLNWSLLKFGKTFNASMDDIERTLAELRGRVAELEKNRQA